MEQLNLLLLLCFSMLLGSFLSGLVPLAFRLSDSKSRLLALMASGILVGTALAIIIPEGIGSLYAPNDFNPIIHTKPTKILEKQRDLPSSSSAPDLVSESNVTPSPKQHALIIGLSLITGFILMLLIDQFSIYQAGGIGHSGYPVDHVGHHGDEYALTNQHDDDQGDDEEDDDEIEQYNRKNLFEASGIDENSIHIKGGEGLLENSDTSLRVTIRGHGDHKVTSFDNSGTNNPTKSRKNILRFEDVTGTKVTPTLGLVIHASADGIALGAAATTSHREVEMIIFLAIMLHKAPAAFSLVVFLLHQGLKHSTIRQHLMAFSLSAPLAALVTYFGLSQSGKEALRQNNATGIAMLFSAGTFLYVATVHVLPELVHNKLLSTKELLFLMTGAFLPILLAQSV